MIPQIDISALFGSASPGRDAADRAVMEAAAGIGFMIVTGFAGAEWLVPGRRKRLLKIFSLPEAEKKNLWRWNFDNSRPNVYRGWFALQPGALSHKEGIDMGPDVAHGDALIDPSDPLCEATPLPPESLVPGWRGAIADYYRAMEKTGAVLMRSIARGLALDETIFDEAFHHGISTLRLARYPTRSENAPQPADPAVVGGAHVDSGFVTLLAQDGVEGLQAQARSGDWVPVPPRDGTLAVNFGGLLQRWSGGRVRATRHRVMAPGRERFSIPFFYEPRADAEIAPLPIAGAEPFEPFLYGDYLWEMTTKFVEQRGISHLRQPRRATA
ncbi:MAG: 2OG-Fe(II) oxygenase family protein [Arenicellales bacterium]